MANKKIILIGMPAVGKSFWGNKLAKAYGFDFIDLDNEIEESVGMSIADIFQHHNEQYFREKEKHLLREVLLKDAKAVIATGGGTPCFYNNFELMKEFGFVVYLKAETDYLIQNLKKYSQLKRPLISNVQTDKELKEKLQDLQDSRKAFYEQADIQIDIKEITLSQIIKIISAEG